MKRGKRGRNRKSSPKQSLNLPDLDQARSAVLNSRPSKESHPGYRHAIDEFIAWYCSEPGLSFNKAAVTRYRFHLESRQLALGVRSWSYDLGLGRAGRVGGGRVSFAPVGRSPGRLYVAWSHRH